MVELINKNKMDIAKATKDEPRHVLMLEGLLKRYFGE